MSSAFTSEPFQVFTGIFTAEMVLKLLAMDPYFYFQVGRFLLVCQQLGESMLLPYQQISNSCFCHDYRLAGTSLTVS